MNIQINLGFKRKVCNVKGVGEYCEYYNPTGKYYKFEKKLKHKAERKYYKKQILDEIEEKCLT